MYIVSAIKYYIQSAITLIGNFNFWSFPIVLAGQPLLVRIKDGPKFYVSKFMDIWILKETIVDKQYEPFRRIASGDVVVDVGAAFGDFSIYAGQKARNVIAYECDAERVALMKRNMVLNGLTNIDLRHERARSLRQIMDDVVECDFLKIDCEGGEYELFENADRATLDKVGFIAMEAHRFDSEMEVKYEELLDALKKNGFEVCTIRNAVHEYINFVFAHRKGRDTLATITTTT